jgi:hypothetical protein
MSSRQWEVVFVTVDLEVQPRRRRSKFGRHTASLNWLVMDGLGSIGVWQIPEPKCRGRQRGN